MLYLGVAVAVAIAVLLVVVFIVPSLTGSTGSSPGGTGTVLTYSGARPFADHAVSGFQGGGWTLLLAAGLVSAVSESVPVNTTALGNISCVFTPAVLLTSLTLPGYSGNRSSGAAPAWEFVYRNSEDTIALVSVIEGQGTVLGTLTGLECLLFSQLFTPIPGNVIDSSKAAGAVEPEAHAFLSAHPNASAEYALVGGYSIGGRHPGPDWAVSYNTCSLSPTASGNGVEFNATVNATTGRVVSTNTTVGVSCGSGTVPPQNQVSTSLIIGPEVVTVTPRYTNYSFAVGFAENGITWSNLTAEVVNGSVLGSSPPVWSGWTLTALTSAGATIATYDPVSVSWSGGATQPLVVGDELVLTTTVNLSGDVLFLEGEGSFVGGQPWSL